MKKKNLEIFLGIVLLLIVIGILVFLFLPRSEFEETNNIVPSQELNINSELVQRLYKISNPSNDGGILKELYSDGKPTNAYILAMGAMEYIRDNISIDDPMVQNMMFTATITKQQLKKYIYRTFGDIEYQDENFYVLNPEYGVCGFTYQPEAERYVSLNGCGGSGSETFLRQVISARQEEKAIYIVEKSVYVYFEGNDYISRRYIYKDCSKEEMIDYQEVDATVSNPLFIDPYLDQAATYEYVFENNNGQYIFKGLIKK